jgi:hypothetical protein
MAWPATGLRLGKVEVWQERWPKQIFGSNVSDPCVATWGVQAETQRHHGDTC